MKKYAWAIINIDRYGNEWARDSLQEGIPLHHLTSMWGKYGTGIALYADDDQRLRLERTDSDRPDACATFVDCVNGKLPERFPDGTLVPQALIRQVDRAREWCVEPGYTGWRRGNK